MITTVSKIITNPTLVNLAQNTDASVTTKTTVNAIGRPGFILIDKNINKETKKFAATKEFLYQATCLAVYMTLIVPIFKKQGFKIAKNKIFKNTQGFEHFKNFSEYTNYRRLADEMDIKKRAQEQAKILDKKKIKFNKTLLDELKKDTPEKFKDIKGAVDFSNIIGSVVGLALVAPQVSQALIHPVLKLIGLEKKSPTTQQQVDVKA